MALFEKREDVILFLVSCAKIDIHRIKVQEGALQIEAEIRLPIGEGKTGSVREEDLLFHSSDERF